MRWKDKKYQISQALNHQKKDEIYRSLFYQPFLYQRGGGGGGDSKGSSITF